MVVPSMAWGETVVGRSVGGSISWEVLSVTSMAKLTYAVFSGPEAHGELLFPGVTSCRRSLKLVSFGLVGGNLPWMSLVLEASYNLQKISGRLGFSSIFPKFAVIGIS